MYLSGSYKLTIECSPTSKLNEIQTFQATPRRIAAQMHTPGKDFTFKYLRTFGFTEVSKGKQIVSGAASSLLLGLHNYGYDVDISDKENTIKNFDV